MTTCKRSAQQLLLPSISSAEASPVRMSAVPASELALQVLAAACGLSSTASFQSFVHGGWWSRTSPAERMAGLTRWSQGWRSLGTRRYRSRLRRRMLALRTTEPACSLLRPTLTAKANLLSPMASHPEGLRDRKGRKLLPTLTARDRKGPGPTHTKSGVDLPQVIGGHLSPVWCEWFMGFPSDWTAPMIERRKRKPRKSTSYRGTARASKRSVTPSSRSARKSSAG